MNYNDKVEIVAGRWQNSLAKSIGLLGSRPKLCLQLRSVRRVMLSINWGPTAGGYQYAVRQVHDMSVGSGVYSPNVGETADIAIQMARGMFSRIPTRFQRHFDPFDFEWVVCVAPDTAPVEIALTPQLANAEVHVLSLEDMSRSI